MFSSSLCVLRTRVSAVVPALVSWMIHFCEYSYIYFIYFICNNCEDTAIDLNLSRPTVPRSCSCRCLEVCAKFDTQRKSLRKTFLCYISVFFGNYMLLYCRRPTFSVLLRVVWGRQPHGTVGGQPLTAITCATVLCQSRSQTSLVHAASWRNHFIGYAEGVLKAYTLHKYTRKTVKAKNTNIH